MGKNPIYLDNAATSFPKPPQVARAVYDYILHSGASFGRGGYRSAGEAMEKLWQARETVTEIIGGENPQRLIFTKNATEALNTAILGSLENGDEVIISPLEHNSVMRPLKQLGCRLKLMPLDAMGYCDVSTLRDLITENTKMVILNHGSNVSGVINDAGTAAQICHTRNIRLLLDCSQTAGHDKIYGEKWDAMIAFAGHKGLLGPQGTGGLYLPPKYNPRPVITGGTGSNSEMLSQPEILPDKYESGTLNMAAICGLSSGCDYIKRRGLEEISYYERRLSQRITEGLMNIKGVTVLCPEARRRTAAVSFYAEGKDVGEIGDYLDREYNIAVRCGLHCAPMAHSAYGTKESGTVRVSPGLFNSPRDVDKLLLAIRKR